jgi:hypothetical protein
VDLLRTRVLQDQQMSTGQQQPQQQQQQQGEAWLTPAAGPLPSTPWMHSLGAYAAAPAAPAPDPTPAPAAANAAASPRPFGAVSSSPPQQPSVTAGASGLDAVQPPLYTPMPPDVSNLLWQVSNLNQKLSECITKLGEREIQARRYKAAARALQVGSGAGSVRRGMTWRG